MPWDKTRCAYRRLLAPAWVLGCMALCAGCSSAGSAASDVVDAMADSVPDSVAGDLAPADVPVALPTAAEILQAGPYGVGTLTLDLEDKTRPTPDSDTLAGTNSRLLSTAVWYPTVPTGAPAGATPGAPQAQGGPWPLIAYAHGFFSFNVENEDLAILLASYGFVVAAPLFPLTNIGTSGGPNAADVVNQPGDMKFVIDSMLASSADPSNLLYGMVDPARIGVMGVSLGGLTSVLTGFHATLRDPRVKAVAAAATPGCYLPADFFQIVDLPLLLLHGTRDWIIPYAANGPPLYAEAQAPKTFVSFQGGTHAGMAGLAKAVLEKTNSDQVGCDTLVDNTTATPEALATLSAQFGGKPHDVALAECPAICGAKADTEPAMVIDRQLRIVMLSSASFFRSVLAGDAGCGRFLREGLAAEGSDLTVQHVP